MHEVQGRRQALRHLFKPDFGAGPNLLKEKLKGYRGSLFLKHPAVWKAQLNKNIAAGSSLEYNVVKTSAPSDAISQMPLGGLGEETEHVQKIRFATSVRADEDCERC